MLTVICCGGGPELAHPQTYDTTKASGNENQRLGMSHPFLPHPRAKTVIHRARRAHSREAIPSHYTTRSVKLVALVISFDRRYRVGLGSHDAPMLALMGHELAQDMDSMS